ncbi:MAG: DUF2634 domain-containing protein [Oscillospiraceae bacterium]
MSLFPILQPIVSSQPRESALPLACDVAWDFSADLPIFEGGEPKPCFGLDAVKVWAFNALLTERRKSPAFSPNYGNDAGALIGTAYSEELKLAEATRYVSECLLASPYISEVSVNEISFKDETIFIELSFKSVYGEGKINV